MNFEAKMSVWMYLYKMLPSKHNLFALRPLWICYADYLLCNV